jgi:hypothetical protein
LSGKTLKLWKSPLSKNMKSSVIQYLLPRQVTHSAILIQVYNASQQFIAFIDPSADASNPGWPLRNLLAYLRALYPAKTSALRILRWKDAESSGLPDGSWRSQIGTIKIPPAADAGTTVDPTTKPAGVGWEKNPQGKLGPRVADLAPMMDPTRLAGYWFKVGIC